MSFGADSASVNSGKKNGVKTKLQTENQWLTFGWCVAHRLELALKHALTGTTFDEIDELILRLYYVYKKSPKKLRQLKELCEIYEDSQFCESGYRPKKASGTVYSIFCTMVTNACILKTHFLMFKLLIFKKMFGS